MDAGLQRLVRLDASQVRSAAEMLSRAFRDDAILRHYFPDESEWRRVAPSFFSIPVYCGVRYGEAYATSASYEGAAVWLPSDAWPLSFLKLVRAVPLSFLFALGRYGGYRMKAAGKHIDAVHRRLAPFRHWYLQVVGVDPPFQGKGCLSRLLRPMLARMDEEGVPCYLETTNPRNVPVYEHYGFRLLEQNAIPRTDIGCWAMLRNPK
jgi:ribosomal protein S18 acetylase RimI-like enzyme